MFFFNLRFPNSLQHHALLFFLLSNFSSTKILIEIDINACLDSSTARLFVPGDSASVRNLSVLAEIFHVSDLLLFLIMVLCTPTSSE